MKLFVLTDNVAKLRKEGITHSTAHDVHTGITKAKKSRWEYFRSCKIVEVEVTEKNLTLAFMTAVRGDYANIKARCKVIKVIE